MSLKGKVAVVTGSTRGIGRAIAEALIAEGVSVIICSRRQRDVDRAVTECRRRGNGNVAGITCDVQEYRQVQRLMDFAVQELGGLDILVNNAGVAYTASVVDLKPEEWREIIGTNLTGVFYCCHEALPKMQSRGVATSSTSAPSPGQTPTRRWLHTTLLSSASSVSARPCSRRSATMASG